MEVNRGVSGPKSPTNRDRSVKIAILIPRLIGHIRRGDYCGGCVRLESPAWTSVVSQNTLAAIYTKEILGRSWTKIGVDILGWDHRVGFFFDKQSCYRGKGYHPVGGLDGSFSYRSANYYPRTSRGGSFSDCLTKVDGGTGLGGRRGCYSLTRFEEGQDEHGGFKGTFPCASMCSVCDGLKPAQNDTIMVKAEKGSAFHNEIW